MSDERILVVDDHALVVQVCAGILADEGYQVCEACSGQEALARLEEEYFDCVVVDLKMPGVDGLTVLRRGRELHPGLAAIMTTSYATLENAVAALRAGAQDFLLKPFDPDELLETVGKALATQRREQAAVEDRAVRQQLAGILERISDGLVALDAGWRCTYVNEGAAIMLNRLRPEDLIGKHIWTEYPEGVGQPFQLACQRAMREQAPIILEHYFAPWDRWFENRIYPSPEGLTIYIREITERRRAQGELKTHNEHLEDLMAGREAHTTGLQDTIHQRDAQLEVVGLTSVANDPSATEGGGVT